MLIGTNTLGITPSVVPSKPRAATPMTVMVWPLTVTASPITAGLLPNCDSQNPCPSTTSGWAPGVTSSAGVKRRPRAGGTDSVGK